MPDVIPLRQEKSGVRSILMENLPWSPLDFIRSISVEGDRAIHVDHLTREIDEENDLRLVCRYPNGEKLAVFAERLSWDSDFFGYGVGKLDSVFPLSPPFYRPYADYGDALSRMLEEARKKGIKYLFASVDPRDLATLRALGQLGFCLIETRSYYHMSVKDYEYKERYSIRVADENDVDRLGRTAQEMVNMYDRFHSDPFIRPEDADRLMYKWMQASIMEGFADVTIVPDFPNPTAFCTVKYHKDKWERWGLKLAQPVFSAVSPEYKGWYRKIISEINYHLRDLGAEHSYLITQITNIAVSWIWEGLGYRFGKGEHILRIILQ